MLNANRTAAASCTRILLTRPIHSLPATTIYPCLHKATTLNTTTSRPFSTTPNPPFKWTNLLRSTGADKKAKVTESGKNAEEVSSVSVITEPAWPHPVYTEEQINQIKIAHRETKDWSDWAALSAVRILRWGFDLATGYKHDKEIARGKGNPSNVKRQIFTMTHEKWLVRFIFLESIAGVPPMVAGMVRHLHSLRKMRRDNGWIETLLEEAYNERMHLLTFLQLRKPGPFMRLMILGAQGVFFNAFFLSYLVSPRTCHRFVGYLEEEAVITYTRAIADLEAQRIPEWQDLKAPEIALSYWRMKEGSTMKDLLNYIRADEAKHREVNHTLANMSQEADPNPFGVKYGDSKDAHPVKGLEWTRAEGWERKEVLEKVGKKVVKEGSLPL
ncbi:mitochondrial cyanide-resistant terminal oxidase [Peziza echinospora]|nr:mitochondrial cyanide-resistant terminal oxidase [Peziza echinospora]